MTVLMTISRSGAHAGAVTEDHSTGEVPERARRRSFTAAYKLQVLAVYEAAEPGRRGEELRREGLYSSHLVEWRRARDAGALAGLAATRGRPPADPVERDNARLRERNAKLEADLDTARRVIEVQGEVWLSGRCRGCRLSA
jgi:transposase